MLHIYILKKSLVCFKQKSRYVCCFISIYIIANDNKLLKKIKWIKINTHTHNLRYSLNSNQILIEEENI